MKLPLAILALIAAILLPSCGVRLDADGAKEFHINGASFVETLQILSEK